MAGTIKNHTTITRECTLEQSAWTHINVDMSGDYISRYPREQLIVVLDNEVVIKAEPGDLDMHSNIVIANIDECTFTYQETTQLYFKTYG
jgi:hypothetical protein|tara:strand:+ start:9008 stop:9277 length:270 start_codon:yes stop_codon:yes gene_type:complete